jgi:hypothetical protein
LASQFNKNPMQNRLKEEEGVLFPRYLNMFDQMLGTILHKRIEFCSILDIVESRKIGLK